MEPTRLVVLASGVGKRLRGKTGPRPLVRVAGLTLIERTLVAARAAGFEEVVGGQQAAGASPFASSGTSGSPPS